MPPAVAALGPISACTVVSGRRRIAPYQAYAGPLRACLTNNSPRCSALAPRVVGLEKRTTRRSSKISFQAQFANRSRVFRWLWRAVPLVLAALWKAVAITETVLRGDPIRSQ